MGHSYVVTGRAAHGRVGRLFQKLLDEEEDGGGEGWIDMSPYAKTLGIDEPPPIAFLWENAPRAETKSYRDDVRCYSHLPNGILLDDKWALARLLGQQHTRRDNCKNDEDDDVINDPNLATLESHCFRGAEFAAFAQRVGLLVSDEANANDAAIIRTSSNCNQDGSAVKNATTSKYKWEDLLLPSSTSDNCLPPPPPPSNLWVIKDAMSNGAGGIWIVDETNVNEFVEDDVDCCSDKNYSSSILHPTHRYIAQRYAWPPTLYDGRKCHVRVYGLITSDGRAYVHRKAFLHVANEPFRVDCSDGEEKDETTPEGRSSQKFESSVHITNCCANSHDLHKFAGEICVDLETPGPISIRENSNHVGAYVNGGDGEMSSTHDSTAALPLGDYLPSIAASMAALAKRMGPFVRGGEANCGFEYLGIDYVLSSVEGDGGRRKPVAYMLEVNAPPSQDTATGLDHAEALHDEVISDLLKLSVLPNLGFATRKMGGWRCVYAPNSAEKEENGATSSTSSNDNLIVPSKAAILNRIRWAMFERRALKEYDLSSKELGDVKASRKDDAKQRIPQVEINNGGLDTKECKDHDDECSHCESRNEMESSSFDLDAFVTYVRSQFPYFVSSEQCDTTSSSSSSTIFFESGGGAQVPRIVSNAVMSSMSNRDRSNVGALQQSEARAALSSLLINDCVNQDKSNNNHVVILGSNATSLLDLLARKMHASGIIAEGDEIVLASENHLANVTPWLDIATVVGAKVKWWTVTDANEQQDGQHCTNDLTESCILSELVNEKTKIVAISHVSNVLGMERDVQSICNLVHRVTKNRGQVVVDGVAAAPHLLSSRAIMKHIDWYVVSLHKLFGPHLGCLLGNRSSAVKLYSHYATPGCEAASINDEKLCKSFEMGTMNYEACCGAIALSKYFVSIAIKARECCGVGCDDVSSMANKDKMCQTSNQITSESSNDHFGGDRRKADHCITGGAFSYVDIARMSIQCVEKRLLHHLLGSLQSCAPLVRIIQDTGEMKVTDNTDDDDLQQLPNGKCMLQRIPIVCFVHANIPSREIAQHCRTRGLVCRACKFLSTARLWDEFDVQDFGLVRFSLAHYNTLEEIDRSIRILEMLNGWHPS